MCSNLKMSAGLSRNTGNKKMAILRAFAILCAVFFSVASYATMELNNVIFHFEPGDDARQDVEVSNTGEAPLYVEIVPTQVLSPGEVTEDRAILALAGPRSREILARLTDADLSNEAFRWLTGHEIEVGFLFLRWGLPADGRSRFIPCFLAFRQCIGSGVQKVACLCPGAEALQNSVAHRFCRVIVQSATPPGGLSSCQAPFSETSR